MLVARPFAEISTGTRSALFAASYVTIGLASIAVPLERERPLAPGLALLCGLGAVVVAANVSGSPVPLAWSAAALPLSLLAAVAEEALFRRLAYARLERFGAAVAVVGSAVLFGLVHVPAYGFGAACRRGRRAAVRVAAVGLGDLDGPRRDACGRQRAGGAPMRRGAGVLLALAMLAGASCTSSSREPIRIGAVYPLSGAQGPGASTSSRVCGSPSSS